MIIVPAFLSLARKAAACLGRFERRSVWVERVICGRMTTDEVLAARMACAESGSKIGDFYAWKFMQMAYFLVIDRVGRAGLIRLIEKMDGTVYQEVDEVFKEKTGLIVAIPHCGLFVLSILAIAGRARGAREVYIFYESPENLSGNKTFDDVYKRVFGGPESGVSILHNTRSGIARAFNALRSGAVVIIMPDVFRSVDDTFLVPFLGRPFNVALGVGGLSSRTRSAVLPMVSEVSDRLDGFRIRIGELIRPCDGIVSETDSRHVLHGLLDEYGTTVKVFSQLEVLMRGRIHQWQYIQRGFRGRPVFGPLSGEKLNEFAKAILSDPRLMIDMKFGRWNGDERQT